MPQEEFLVYEPREGQGALFKNNKGDNEKRPDYRGTLMVGGRQYKLSAWVKEGARGKFLSINAQPDDGERADAPF